jgi:fumarate reductase subunit D
MKRSNAPVYWSLFGAGGMLSALVAPGLVIVVMSGRLDYANAFAIARNPLGKAFLFAVASLFLWHAAHRIFHTLHDFGIRTGVLAWILCYGVALAGTLVAASALLRIGF